MRVINLLPSAEQKILAQERIFQNLRKFMIFTFSSYLVLILILIGWRFAISRTLQNIDADIAAVQQQIKKQDNEKVKAQITSYNNVIADYNNFAKNNPNWSVVLDGFSRLVPSDVLITAFSANTKTGKIDISGIAAARDSEAVTLRNNLVNSPLFKNVNFPFENLQKPTNVNFSYTFYLNDKVLTNPNEPAK